LFLTNLIEVKLLLLVALKIKLCEVELAFFAATSSSIFVVDDAGKNRA
jgi:hypothetical protein